MKLFVGNLPWSVTDQDLEEMFAPFGAVGSAKVITDRDTGRSRGFGFVEMSDDSARNAIADLNESEISGRKLTVNEAAGAGSRTGTRQPVSQTRDGSL
jgi:RNA recognition motif-containing protein